MRHLSSVLSLFSLSLASLANAGGPCVAFDTSWNLLAFGFNGKDYNASTQDKWASSGTAQDITSNGRPPFDTSNCQCFLSQYYNAIYVLGGNKANLSSIYIYDATMRSWSTQATDTQEFDPSIYSAILDHDTNVFYAYSQGKLFALDMSELKAATATPLKWKSVQDLGFGMGYQPTMALAQNHIHFLNVPGIPAGNAKIFVIHFSFLQPDPQFYGGFPDSHGQATSFFKDSDVQEEFVFIPDDGSSIYVINVERNTTVSLPGPNLKDSLSTYFASKNSLVQLTTSGKVEYLSYDSSADAPETWSPVNALPVAVPSNNNTPSPSVNSPMNGDKTNSTAGIGQSSIPDSAKLNENGAIPFIQTGWISIAISICFGLSTNFFSRI